MNIKKNYANPKNYGVERGKDRIKYLVYHYTANDGDSDEANAKYFQSRILKASAHYFVDDDSITMSVPENMIAFSVGGGRLNSGGILNGICTNTNSISIELCDSKKNGKYDFTSNTLKQAIELGRDIMKRYNIPIERVVRHYDVTGKNCPRPFVENVAYWNAFKSSLISESIKEPTTSTKLDTDYIKRVQKCVKATQTGVPDTATINACPVVKRGSKGEIVKLLQQRLISLRISVGKYNADGSAGGDTIVGIETFQRQYGLPVTEKFDKDDWNKLLNLPE